MHTTKIDWTKFKYVVFDVPNHTGTYKQRYEALGGRIIPPFDHVLLTLFLNLEQLVGNKAHPYIQLAYKEKCRDLAHMETFFQDVIDKGGEGIILRDPEAPYQPGRAPGYLKHKVLFSFLSIRNRLI